MKFFGQMFVAMLLILPLAQAQYVQLSPAGSQVVNQPSGTTLGVTSLNNTFNVSGFPYTCTTNEGGFTTQLECACGVSMTTLSRTL